MPDKFAAPPPSPLARRPCCPHCGQPRRVVQDSATLPVPGLRLAACDCGEGR